MSFRLVENSKIAVIIAHPDDEVLGCGGTISRLVEMGHQVRVVLAIRRNDDRGLAEWNNLISSMHLACKLLGAEAIILEDLMDEQMVEFQLSKLHDKILPYIEWAEIIFTHFSNDVNQVHRAVSRAVEIGTRPFRRRKEVLLFEVPTSTDQGFLQTFSPNIYCVLSEQHVAKKCQALQFYTSEIAIGRDKQNIIAKLSNRGAESGVDYAEAFMLARGFL